IVVGGTSAASPFVAGVFALYGKGTSAPSFPYSNTGAFFDVLTGTNGTCGNILCNATKGWDGPTGVGTPNGAMFASSTAAVPGDMAMGPDMALGPDMAQVVSAGGPVTGGGTSSGTGSGTNGDTGGTSTGSGSTASSANSGIGCSFGGAETAGGGWLLTLGFTMLATWRRRRRNG
ncbi:MAG TPA: MYXO-CTERM sorting domain-containing protein, partial [Polyangia bacterium]|nr:MYXO-CTERM sorting domain-containing protein [Polyangia bacterium]